jgi:hypothetical protein
MLLIDDFGHQSFNPEQLLNRWIVPMENPDRLLKAKRWGQVFPAVRRAAGFFYKSTAFRSHGSGVSFDDLVGAGEDQ